MAQVVGRGESLQVQRITSAAGSAPPTGEDVTGQVNYVIPCDVGLGTAIKPVAGLTLLADMSLQLPASYQSFPASINSEAVSLQAMPRFNLGLEVAPVVTYPVRVGFYYDPSTQGGHPGDPNYQKVDYFGLTAGVGFNSEHVRTSVGGFYIWSSGQMTPADSSASAAVSITGVGAMLSTAYVF